MTPRPTARRVGSALEERLVLECRGVGLPMPEREVRFAPPRRWRFDLAWPAHKVACEVQGGAWVQGRHGRGAGLAADAEKLTAAQIAGWCVVVATGSQVRSGDAVRWIAEALAARGAITLDDCERNTLAPREGRWQAAGTTNREGAARVVAPQDTEML